jgi:hypothetical protein
MGTVVRLADYRRPLTARKSNGMPGKVVRLTPEQHAMDVAMSCVVLSAPDNVQLAGVPSVALAKVSQVGELTWARYYQGEWMPVAEHDIAWQQSRGWTVQRVRMVRFGTPVDVVVDSHGRVYAGVSTPLLASLSTGPQWAYYADGLWRELCHGSFDPADALYFAHASNVAGCERRLLKLERREAGR